MFEKYLAENKGIVITDNEDLAAALHEVYDNIEIVVAESEAEGIVLAARVMAEAEAMQAQSSECEDEDEDEDDVCPLLASSFTSLTVRLTNCSAKALRSAILILFFNC